VARVLIVEDEPASRLTFEEFLKAADHEVVAAEDYAQAVGFLCEAEFDVVITDIRLPGKTGIDLLRTVRSRGLKMPVVVITGDPTVETASEAVRLGAFDYLAKPVTREGLQRVVRLAVDRHGIAQERDHYAAQTDIYRRELEAIFNSVKEGIITVDADMRVRQVNSAGAAMLGLADSDAAGRRFAEVAPSGLDVAREALKQTLKSHEPVTEQHIELRLADGDEKVLVVSTTPLVCEKGAFAGAVLVARDITRLSRLEKQIEESQQYRDMVGKSARMQAIFRLIREDLAETDSTVLIYGESGTGKELVASALHHASARAKGPFLKVNCAALSENLLESELFGHVKGAFTGAVKDRIGRFEAAEGGTILLDEIGDISPRLQLRLLRVLQEREFERVGASIPISCDVRVIASTNRDLVQKIRDGEFRQDLYFRLNVVRMDLPPLRERRSDIPLLVESFRRRFNRQFKKEVTGVAPDATRVLMDHSWPGNVRELENCIERAFIVCRGPLIHASHLPRELLDGQSGLMDDAPEPAKPTAGQGTETERIVSVLTQTDWNVAKAARLLGMARNTLYLKMKALDIKRP
jgi:two-component system, NtrC family, response regulator HydG